MYIDELSKKCKCNIQVYTGIIHGEKKIGSIKIPTFLFKLIIIEKNILGYKIPNEKPIKSSFTDYSENPTILIDLINSYNFEKIIK